MTETEIANDAFNYSDDEEGIIAVSYDCDGLPYIVSDDFNLLDDHLQRKWHDQVYEHIQYLWKYIVDYSEENGLNILDKGKYVDFLRFVAKHSHKFPSKWPSSFVDL